MLLLTWVIPLALLALPVAGENEQTLDLFNGKDLDGWVVEGVKDYRDKESGQSRPVWSVRDGVLVCDGRGFGFLRYARQEFGDFVWSLEYRMARGCNSGVGFRTTAFDPKRSRATRPSFYSYEIQLVDDAGRPAHAHGTGSLYRYVAPKSNPVRPAGEWNSLEVECVGPRIRIRLNGEEIIDLDQSRSDQLKNKPLRGYVCLQNHGRKVEFRNLRIREIKPAAGARLPAER